MAQKDFNKDDFLVKAAPEKVHYIPNFLTSDEEEDLLRQVNESPKPKWTQLSNRRLQNWGGHPHAKGMVAEDLPQWLDDLCDRIWKTGFTDEKRPNHVLVNEYSPGQGIMPHGDGPLFFPVITTINLGCHTVLNFYEPGDPKKRAGGLLLEPRSLVVMRDKMYSELIHGIDEVSEDTLDESLWNLSMTKFKDKLGEKVERESTRVSLTIRHVPKVLKVKLVAGRFVNC